MGAPKFIRFGNTKLKKDGIGSFKLPAGKTCPFAGACKKFCYAQKGNYRYPAVQQHCERMFEASKSPTFVAEMIEEVTTLHRKGKLTTLRLHDSGDFYSKAYYTKWVNIARACPGVTFYAYTKSFGYVNWKELPANFVIIQSVDGIKPVNTAHKHAKVFASRDEALAAGYTIANESDMIALAGDVTKIALIKH